MDLPEEGDQKIIPAKQSPVSSRETLPDDPFSAAYYNAAQTLSYSTNPEEKEKGLAIFRETIKNISHPYYAGALYNLFTFGTEEDKKNLFPLIREFVQNPATVNRFSFACKLGTSGDPEDQTLRDKILREIAQDTANPDYFNAVKTLFYKDPKEVRPTLQGFINNPESPHYFSSIEFLYQQGNKNDRERVLPILREIGKSSTHPNYYDVAFNLYSCNNAEDKKIALGILREIIKNIAHPRYLSAVIALLNNFSGELSEADFLVLMPALFLKDADLYHGSLKTLLFRMLESPYPTVKKDAESIFLYDPLKFIDFSNSSKNIKDMLVKYTENKRDLFLQRICENLESTSSENITVEDKERRFNAASLVLQLSDQEKFVTPAKKVFLKLMDAELGSFMSQIALLLPGAKDVELRARIMTHLFVLAKNLDLDVEENPGNIDGGNVREEALFILLEQDNAKTRAEAIAICQKILDSITPDQVKKGRDFLFNLGLSLHKIEEGKRPVQQISTLLEPEVESMLLPSDPFGMYPLRIKFFMQLGTETQKLKIFNFLKESIVNIEDESSSETEYSSGSESEHEYHDFEDGIDLIIESLGVDHPWSQELIELAAKRQNSTSSDSPFAVYKHLREQVEQPVNHHLPQFQLEDNRTVTFNLKTLQARRQLSYLPMKYDELVRFTKQLLAEAQEHPEEFKLCATEALRLDQSIAMQEVNTAFFKSLLDMEESTKDLQKISLTSAKLRHILKAAKVLHEEGHFSQGLSPSSQLMLSLLNNVLTCSTGKEDGIDQTYRLLTNRRGASEEDLQQERLREEIHEFFKEEMRCMRETLLSGNGPVVRSLLNPSITEEKELKKVEVEEAPHQAKYLGNLLGGEIGTFLEGKSVTFDQNGGCVSSELRKCSKQKALDTLYQYHKLEDIIRDFHERFNALGFTGKIDGKYATTNIIHGLLMDSPDYIVYDDDSYVPLGLTPLAVAEILIKTHILEVVENK